MHIVSTSTVVSSRVIYNWNIVLTTLMPGPILLTRLIFSYQKKVGITKSNRSQGVRFYYGSKTVI